jgi:hypothetical protein
MLTNPVLIAAEAAIVIIAVRTSASRRSIQSSTTDEMVGSELCEARRQPLCL